LARVIENNRYAVGRRLDCVLELGGDSEREFSENIVKVGANSSKKVSEVKDDFAKMQKLKAESLKKVEEMIQSAEKDLEKLEQKIAKSEGLVSESKGRLNAEITAARTQTKQKYDELKSRIVASIVPE
jgi:DNA-binding ferritin-like protein